MVPNWAQVGQLKEADWKSALRVPRFAAKPGKFHLMATRFKISRSRPYSPIAIRLALPPAAALLTDTTCSQQKRLR